MIRSMTGFARAERNSESGSVVWEIRSVNHRYLEVGLRLSEELRSAESEYRQRILGAAKRGKVDAILQYRPPAGAGRGLELDEAFLEELIAKSHDVARQATARGGSLEQPTPLDLLRWPGVLKERPTDGAPLQAMALAALEEALASFAEHRGREGERIAAMLHGRCRQLEGLVHAVRARLPEVRARLTTRLQERIAALGMPADSHRERVEQEIALLLTRMDVDEELDRLTSHIAEVDKALGGDEPAGRRLDFLMQEFNREANTLSSKSQDPETTRCAVEMKVLIEQMREQVQNVE
jgi:uncharacterized protein (TIGR00255 family)